MNKKGFTLIEIIAVIGLIALLSLLVMPNLLNIFNEGSSKVISIQEKEIKSAATMYLEDFCTSPISDDTSCPLTRNANNTYSGELPLESLINSEYIDTVLYKNTVCTGCVIFNSNEASVYLSCNDKYTSEGYSDNCN